MDVPAGRVHQFDGYEVDTLRRELRRGGVVLPLTSKAFDVLCALIARRHEVVAKDVLMALVWPGRIVEENNLNQAIAAVRRAFGVDAQDHRFILTVPGRGYRFVAGMESDQAPLPVFAGAGAGSGANSDAALAGQALLRAEYRLHQRDLSAPRAFLDAIRLDPASARAYAGLARAYLFLAHADVAPNEVFPLARAASLQAIRIDPGSPEAHLAHGRVLQLVEWNWPRAEAELRRALELAPNLAEARMSLAHVLVTTGRFEAGLAEIARAREEEPLSPLANALEGGFLVAAGRGKQAHACLERAFALEPGFWIALLLRAGLALEAGNAAAAVADLECAAEGRPGRTSLVLATLAQAYVANDQSGEAEAVARELRARQLVGYVPEANLAAVHLALGDAGAALDCLERAREARDIRIVFLGIDARWNPLRGTQRFRRLVESLGLPNARGHSRL